MKIESTETRIDMAYDIRQEVLGRTFHPEMYSHNYKSYLTEQKAKNEHYCEVYKKKIKSQQINIKILQDKIDTRQSQVSKLRKGLKSSKDAIKAVADERSFRQKINRLLKKYDYLSVEWDGDDEAYTTWVYSFDFDAVDNFEGDPFEDEHSLDSYQDAHERCLAYIKHHEERRTK